MLRLVLLGPLLGLSTGWLVGFVLAGSIAVDALIPWYLARAAGLTAFVLLTLNVCLGLLMSTRLGDALVARWRTFDLHQFTGLLALGFLGLHVVSLLGDRYIGFAPVQLFVPFLSPYRPLATALGVLGLYLVVLLIASSHLRPHIGLRVWRVIHYASFAAWTLALAHGLLSGSDGAATWARMLYLCAALAVVGLTAWRYTTSKAASRAPDRRSPPKVSFRGASSL